VEEISPILFILVYWAKVIFNGLIQLHMCLKNAASILEPISATIFLPFIKKKHNLYEGYGIQKN
jgi:hypothetical protein